MVFLTLLVSSARRGELHAIAYSTLTCAPNWTNVVLHPIPGFISKLNLGLKEHLPWSPLLSPLWAPLCPVRCLKDYLSRTKPFREVKRLLFISLQKNKSSDITKNTISGLVRSLLHNIYSNANMDAATLVGRSTHAIRSLAASLAFSTQVDLDEILKACSWKNLFKDMTQVRKDVHSLDPLVVVVVP